VMLSSNDDNYKATNASKLVRGIHCYLRFYYFLPIILMRILWRQFQYEYELGWYMKEAITVYLKIILRRSPVKTGENHDKRHMNQTRLCKLFTSWDFGKKKKASRWASYTGAYRILSTIPK
jgi:hypothetical protein